jgi:hypothetical protein
MYRRMSSRHLVSVISQRLPELQRIGSASCYIASLIFIGMHGGLSFCFLMGVPN